MCATSASGGPGCAGGVPPGGESGPTGPQGETATRLRSVPGSTPSPQGPHAAHHVEGEPERHALAKLKKSLHLYHVVVVRLYLLTKLLALIFRTSWFTCFSCWWSCFSTTLTRPKTHTAWDCALSCNKHYTHLITTTSAGIRTHTDKLKIFWWCNQINGTH